MKWTAESYLNLLLIFIPVPPIAVWLGAPETVIFVSACLGIIPLAGLMGKATEYLSERVGSGLGGLLNATFGNACELIISFAALRAGLIDVVKASITGSIIGNVLLVLGAAIFAGGLRYERQTFNRIAATTSATLLALAAISLTVPAVFHYSVANPHTPRFHLIRRALGPAEKPGNNKLGKMDRVAKPKPQLDLVDFSANPSIPEGAELELVPVEANDDVVSHHDPGGSASEAQRSTPPLNEAKLALAISVVLFLTYIANLIFSLKTHRNLYNAEGDAEADDAMGVAQWDVRKSILILCVTTILVAILSEYLVHAIEKAAEAMGLTKIFIGVVLVAIIGNAAEHTTAVLMAVKNKMDLAINIALGSGAQIALFVAPVLVFASFILGKPMDLRFTEIELMAIVVSVIILAFVATDGECNWMEGVQLLAVYLILCATFYLA
jgi:Ca2+:H+ antiporter